MDLNSPLERHFRLGSFQNQALKRLKLETVGDLLRHFPNRYGNVAEMRSIASLSKGETAAIFGKLSNVEMSRAFYKKIPMATAAVEDTSGKIKAVWFNQPYIAKMFPEEALVRLEGKVSERKGGLYFSNPKIERVTEIPTGVGHSLFGEAGKAHTLYPVYPESRGITSNWLYHALLKVIKSGALKTITDPLPTEILSRYHLPSLKTALIWIHTPRDKRDAESARKRFAFEEVFFIQLQKQRARREYEKNPAFVIEKKPEEMENFISRFPFEATAAQRRAIRAVLGDLKSGRAMSRLLEGDVGSGKTAVAATAAYAAVTERPKGQSFGHLQAAYMCPTEILAAQHFDSFAGYFAHLGISVGLLTGSGCRKFPSKVSRTARFPLWSGPML
ncbi:MAG: DEAD/DEAH box helicase [Candidatus Taylorbacteria bacterium]|nr:DEAD/DEAH box helicase [Candidatus Taylorbacteria bacterium]